ncbi:hypothetical protein HK102_003246, partial [Quaeritorhiza haematococci]
QQQQQQYHPSRRSVRGGVVSAGGFLMDNDDAKSTASSWSNASGREGGGGVLSSGGFVGAIGGGGVAGVVGFGGMGPPGVGDSVVVTETIDFVRKAKERAQAPVAWWEEPDDEGRYRLVEEVRMDVGPGVGGGFGGVGVGGVGGLVGVDVPGVPVVDDDESEYLGDNEDNSSIQSGVDGGSERGEGTGSRRRGSLQQRQQQQDVGTGNGNTTPKRKLQYHHHQPPPPQGQYVGWNAYGDGEETEDMATPRAAAQHQQLQREVSKQVLFARMGMEDEEVNTMAGFEGGSQMQQVSMQTGGLSTHQTQMTGYGSGSMYLLRLLIVRKY